MVLPLIYTVATVLIRLCLFVCFFFIPGFVSENFQIQLIVHFKFSSLQLLFLSFSFSFFSSSFSFYECLFCEFLFARALVSMYVYVLSRGVFLLLHFFILNIFDN